MKIFAGCVLALWVALSMPAACADGLPTAPYIQVSGHGELHVAPDMAVVSLTLEKVAPDAKAARADVEARTAKVIALARKLGLADKDIEAPAITVFPEYQWKDNTQHLAGQHVTRRVTLTLRDLSRYGDLVDGLFAAGISTLDGVQSDRRDRTALEEKARALALSNAHDKAAGLAKSAGVNLGAVYSIAEQGSGSVPRPQFAALARNASAQPEYPSGEIEIDADVTVYYLIGK